MIGRCFRSWSYVRVLTWSVLERPRSGGSLSGENKKISDDQNCGEWAQGFQAECRRSSEKGTAAGMNTFSPPPFGGAVAASDSWHLRTADTSEKTLEAWVLIKIIKINHRDVKSEHKLCTLVRPKRQLPQVLSVLVFPCFSLCPQEIAIAEAGCANRSHARRRRLGSPNCSEAASVVCLLVTRRCSREASWWGDKTLN